MYKIGDKVVHTIGSFSHNKGDTGVIVRITGDYYDIKFPDRDSPRTYTLGYLQRFCEPVSRSKVIKII